MLFASDDVDAILNATNEVLLKAMGDGARERRGGTKRSCCWMRLRCKYGLASRTNCIHLYG